MIVDETLLLRRGHLWKGVVFTLKFSGELRKCGGNEFLNSDSVLSGDGSSEWESGHVSGNSDSCGVDHLVLILWEWWAFKLVDIHG